MSNFFSTPVNSETDEIVDELLSKGFSELEASGTGNLFIDTVNKTFWYCDAEQLQKNSVFLQHLKESVTQINLKEIKSWQI